MSGMNKGFAAYLANKKAGKTAPIVTSPKSNVPMMSKTAKTHAKVKTAPANLKHGKYL